jgi:flagellar M-ring protein FliF
MNTENTASNTASAPSGMQNSAAVSGSSSAWQKLQARWLDLPTQSRMAWGALVAAAVIALVALLANTAVGKNYKVLFSNVSGADGAAIVAALQQMNVPYQFTEGGAAIMVPDSVVHETRLKLAGEGLPKSGNVGFELLENQKFGTSQFVERVNYLRGLEGELSRSIGSIAVVKTARVHLAVPKQTAFVREQERASASVLLTLYPGRSLDASQSAAIARLVSSSVPGMLVQDVSILDTEGASLMASQQRAAEMDAWQIKYTSEVENTLASRLKAILQPLAGADSFRAQVTVDMNFDERERTEEVFSRNSPPNQQSIRSEQTVDAGAGADGVGGIPGALSNQPQEPPEAPIVESVATDDNDQARELAAPGRVETGVALTDGSGNRRERTINYEVDRAIERFKPGKGQIRRISAAVILDHKAQLGTGERVAYTPEEIQQITTLVRDAIGFVPGRGDTVSVVNLPFSAVEAPVAKDLLSPELVSQLLQYLAIALGVLFLWFAILKPLLWPKRTVPDAAPTAANGPRGPDPELHNPDQMAQEREEFLALQRQAWLKEEAERNPTPEQEQQRFQEDEMAKKRRYDELVSYLQQYVSQEPDKTALQLRAWVAEPAPGGARGGREMERS